MPPYLKAKSRLHVKFAQKMANADYIRHLYYIFRHFVGTPPRVQAIRGGGARNRHKYKPCGFKLIVIQKSNSMMTNIYIEPKKKELLKR